MGQVISTALLSSKFFLSGLLPLTQLTPGLLYLKIPEGIKFWPQGKVETVRAQGVLGGKAVWERGGAWRRLKVSHPGFPVSPSIGSTIPRMPQSFWVQCSELNSCRVWGSHRTQQAWSPESTSKGLPFVPQITVTIWQLISVVFSESQRKFLIQSKMPFLSGEKNGFERKMDSKMLCHELVYSAGIINSDVCRKQVVHDFGSWCWIS